MHIQVLWSKRQTKTMLQFTLSCSPVTPLLPDLKANLKNVIQIFLRNFVNCLWGGILYCFSSVPQHTGLEIKLIMIMCLHSRLKVFESVHTHTGEQCRICSPVYTYLILGHCSRAVIIYNGQIRKPISFYGQSCSCRLSPRNTSVFSR